MSIGLYIDGEIRSLDTKIDKMVTKTGISVDNISVEDTILIHPIALNAAIPRNLSMEAISTVYEENFELLRELSVEGENALGGADFKDVTGFRNHRLRTLSDNVILNRPKGTDGFDEEENKDDYVWEYDCMTAFMHIIPFNFTIDKEPKPLVNTSKAGKNGASYSDRYLQNSCILPEPLRIHLVDYSPKQDKSIVEMYYHKDGKYYLNATVASYYRYREMRKTDGELKQIVSYFNEKYQYLGDNLDFSKLVYGLYLSGIFLKLPKAEAQKLKTAMDCITTVVSEYVLTNSSVRKAYINLDSVVTKEPWNDDFKYDLYRVKHKYEPLTGGNVIESFKNTYRLNEIPTFTKDENLPSIMGWYSADIERILKNYPGYKAYHIDIHAAYVNLAKSLANLTITKDETGKIKSANPYLYQEICDTISKRSRYLTHYFEDQLTVFWQTDGGLCLIKDNIDVTNMIEENQDVVIEQVVGRTMHKLPEAIDVSFLANTSLAFTRIFAYTIFVGKSKKESTLSQYYANNFKLYLKRIIEENSIKGVKDLDMYGLIKTISEFSDNNDGK